MNPNRAMTLPAAIIRAIGWFGACAILAGCPEGDDVAQLAPEDAGPEPDVDLALCVTDGPIGMPRPNCPNDLPSDVDCATASPMYQDVAPIFAARCSVCHRVGGFQTTYLFDTYAQIYVDTTRTRILTQIYGCRMPPSCAPNLAAEERATMLKWLVCGAPESRDAGNGDAPVDDGASD